MTDRYHRKPHRRSPTGQQRQNERRRIARAKAINDLIRVQAYEAGLLTTPPAIPTLAQLLGAV